MHSRSEFNEHLLGLGGGKEKKEKTPPALPDWMQEGADITFEGFDGIDGENFWGDTGLENAGGVEDIPVESEKGKGKGKGKKEDDLFDFGDFVMDDAMKEGEQVSFTLGDE